ncbi:PTS sugar transporter subunit IIA [Bacillus cytotoxicus]|uniref:PTS system, glucose subfamily, IIA subunit n=1 Tax=Bacillus cytotoxicus (strain DSM 22905 / CIP 110041 / 391-98 / NVH 391-98) TaxID=315749 RepID=A7GV70_BACCN|nr:MULTISPECIES: PTS glucose transporter subunit IIA [Bacillus cereus group]ABS24028.1 PTS system, glucose subfamily, IIA subunit [Bacillus cytotoxicus NVH 391-98]AWC30604.1 PTS glucose transporter subunit IIA [Bacillus cytotoxicus]AWC34660.1 PTS glucose transporter subunit IIA [Bacillus cytotoxicus]AWC38653.1 PTS glucose transporter subunit IIA [Bacillus cytotoxicus]AWC42746.1 PTS glucose transporter subunit IIA [Bacillus cytotoxicus]
MFKKLFGFGSKTNEETIVAPLTGEVKNIEEVPDPVFAGRMMGDGIAIVPTEGVVVSPVDGEIVQLFHTKHAVGIKAKNGTEILIHVGLETVKMEGEGFEAHVSEGQAVKKGDKLISFDLEIIREKAKSTITPVVITNTDAAESIKTTVGVSATKGETEVMKVIMK